MYIYICGDVEKYRYTSLYVYIYIYIGGTASTCTEKLYIIQHLPSLIKKPEDF